MLLPAEKKIVIFPADASLSGGDKCESCGSPKQTTAFCRACAFSLIDAALDEASEEIRETTQSRYDHYEICRTSAGDLWELGRGAMGITYKATDTHLNCPVALKVINARRLGGASARDRFLREARTAALLRHPNIASVFHLGLGEEDCFYAMEYIVGETLETHVSREGAMPWRSALNILAQSARALRAAHAQQFIHRDIKPANVMLVDGQHKRNEDLTVKVIDFGLVKVVADEFTHEACSETYFAGTPHFASPEQLRSEAVDPRSDIYSLGMCLSYMLAGKPLLTVFHKTDEVLGAGTSSMLADFSARDVPESVISLVETMVSPIPDRRPETVDVLLDLVTRAISEVQREQLGASEPSHPPRKVALLMRTHWRVCAATIVVVVLVVCVTLASWTHRGVASAESLAAVPSVSVESRLLYAQAQEAYLKYTKADNQRAIELFSKAIALSPAYSDAYAMLASAYYDNVSRHNMASSELDLAIAAAQHAIALNPNTPGAFQVLGAIRGFQGRPWDALIEVHRALELNPKLASAMCDFGLLWTCVGEPQFALPWAKAAAQLEPSKVRGWHAAAEACVEMCDDEAAEGFYQRCAEIRPVWTPAYCGLMHIHLLQGNFARAREDYAKAESIQKGMLLPLTLNAQVALFSGDDVTAEACYRRLLALNRKGMVRYYSGISYLSALGFLRLKAGDAAEGGNLLAEAEELHSSGSEGSEDIYDLAAIRAVQNRKEDALVLFEQAIRSGWRDYRASRLDPRFTSLRKESRFNRLLDDLSIRVAEMRKETNNLCAKTLALADYPVRPHGRTCDK